jgi:hypothetical protein
MKDYQWGRVYAFSFLARQRAFPKFKWWRFCGMSARKNATI